MNGSIGSIVLSGFGNGTFAGSPSLVVMMGFGIGSQTSTLTGTWSNVTIARIDRTVSEVEIKK